MLYYKVKPECDNQTRYKKDRNGQCHIDGILVGDELYTPGEIKCIANQPECFEQVQVSKYNTYFFFGARFEF